MLSRIMRTVPRSAAAYPSGFVARAVAPILSRSHCQVPCGIFDDPMRVEALKEDAATVRKAMVQINELSGQGTPLALNQVGFGAERPAI